MARRAKQPTKLERRELRLIRRDYLKSGMSPEEVDRKIKLYQKFLAENRSVGI